MHPQLDIFAGRKARDEGIKRVTDHNQEFLRTARMTAEAICRLKGTVTADDVRKALEGVLEPYHPNAWGGLFSSSRFEFTGQYVQSNHPSRRAGMQRVWRLRT